MQKTEFWKKKKQRQSDDGARSSKSTKKQAPSTNRLESIKSSDISWANKLLPASLKKGSRVDYTVSIAIPSSILKTAKSTELKTYLVGQIARACAIHEVDEIIVYMDSPYESSGDLESGPGVFFCRLLQYLECPSYLRSTLFPVHDDLKFVSLLPLLDMPHHMKSESASLYREGIIIDKPVANGSLVNVGLSDEAFIEYQLQPGIRVTVKLDESSLSSSEEGVKTKQPIAGEVVSPSSIRQEHGLYWGYQTRLAKSFGEVFSGCPYIQDSSEEEEAVPGYDLLIGHSEKGAQTLDNSSLKLPRFKHALIVFGGAGGIEASVEADKSITTKPENAYCLFDHWLDLAPTRGSKLVRTEEALLVGLAKLTPLILRSR